MPAGSSVIGRSMSIGGRTARVYRPRRRGYDRAPGSHDAADRKDGMDYIRKLDVAALAATDGRFTQMLLGRDSGGSTCEINCIKTPVGDGSPAGLHTHPFDQVFYILEGTMSLEIDGSAHEAGPGTLVASAKACPIATGTRAPSRRCTWP